MELIGLAYILLGLLICGVTHLRKYGTVYEEKLPVIFRLKALKRLIRELLG